MIIDLNKMRIFVPLNPSSESSALLSVLIRRTLKTRIKNLRSMLLVDFLGIASYHQTGQNTLLPLISMR